jgi:hypothetical protein
MILDSPYHNLVENIVYLVKAKTSILPEWLIKLALKVLNSKIGILYLNR